MIGAQMDVTVPLDILDAIQDTAVSAPGKMRTAYRRAVKRLRTSILRSLKVEPKKPTYPLRWKSKKQRAAYFATNGFGHGIPYQRTGKLLNSYDVQLLEDPNGAILRVVNSDPKAEFVIGDFAQPFHLDTGWVQMAEVISDARVEAEEVLIQTWYTVTDAFAGARG